MRNLIKYELTKVISNRIMLLLFALLLALNGIMAVNSTKKEDHEDTVIAFYAAYVADADTAAYWRAYYDDIQLQNKQLEEEWYAQWMAGNREFPLLHYDPDLISGSEDLTDKEILALLFRREDTVNGLSDYYKGIAKEAEENRLELLEEGFSEHSYAVTVQEKTRDRYGDLAEKIAVDFTYPRGWDRYFAFGAVDLFILLFLLLTASQIFPTERRLRMEPILRAAPNGGTQTTIAKLTAMLTITTATVLIFVAETLLFFGIRLGFSPLSDGIQLFEGFRLVPFALSTGGYLALSVLSKWLAFCALAAFVMLLSVLTHSTILSFACGAVFYGVSWFFWQYHYIGTPPAFYYVNLVSATQFVVPSERYKLFGTGRLAVNAIALTFLLAVAVIAIASVLTVFFRRKNAGKDTPFPVVKGKQLVQKMLAKLPKKARRPRPHLHGTFLWECHKNFIARGRIFLILLLVAVKLIASYSSIKPLLYSEVLLKEYTDRWGGELNEEVLEEIEEEQRFVNDIMGGHYPSDDPEQNILLYEYAKGHQTVINELAARADHLWRIHEQTKIPVYILYDHGWEMLFGKEPDMLLYAGLLLLLCGLFSSEHGKDGANGNLYAMLRSTPGGRRRTFLSKISAALLFSFLLACLFTAVDLHATTQMQPLHLPQSTLISLHSFEAIRTAFTVKQYLAAWCVFRVVSATVLALLVTALSELLRNAVLTLSATAFLTVTPTLLVSFGFSEFFRVAFLDLFAVSPLVQNSFAFEKQADWMFFKSFLLVCGLISLSIVVVAYLVYQKHIQLHIKKRARSRP